MSESLDVNVQRRAKERKAVRAGAYGDDGRALMLCQIAELLEEGVHVLKNWRATPEAHAAAALERMAKVVEAVSPDDADPRYIRIKQ